ncbi:alpha/beta hydrolase [Acidobacteria bacterium AB60]|nr:alpha/beta hydrolase [Acidobacteria bacterium AB60]
MRTIALSPFIAILVIGCVSVHRTSPYDPVVNFRIVYANDANGVQTFAILPSTYDSGTPNRWVIYNHGFGQIIDQLVTYDPQSRFLQSLTAAGFVVLASDYRNLACWGNQECSEDMANLQVLWHLRLNLSAKPFVIGESMGGIVTWNAIAHGALKPLAVVGIYPVCSLAAMDKNAVLEPTIQSAYGFSAQTGYATATSGYDPMLAPASPYSSFPIAVWASYADHVVVRSANEDPFALKIQAAGGNVVIHTSSGEHGDLSNFDASSVVAFFRRSAQ